MKTETGVFPFFAVDFTYSRSQNELPAKGTSARIEVNAVSRTNNIVGDVFVNMINSANESAQDESRPLRNTCDTGSLHTGNLI